MSLENILNKRFIVTGFLVLFSIIFLGFFGQDDAVDPVFQMLLVSTSFFLVVPVFYSKIVLKESLKNLGWQRGNLFLGALLGMVCVAAALMALFFLARYTSFAEEYVLPVTVETDFVWFILYELVLVTFITLLYEVFFRGLVQTLWLKSFGVWAVLLQASLFVALFYLGDDISWQTLPVLLFSPLAGVIAYYSQSIWYSWAASFALFFLTDVFLLTLR